MAYDYPFWYLQTYLPKAPSTELLIALPKNSVKGYSLLGLADTKVWQYKLGGTCMEYSALALI
jgi:hypothetical protein